MKGSLQFTELDGRFKGNDVFKWMVNITHNPEYENRQKNILSNR